MPRRPATRSTRAAENNPFLVLPENQLAYSAAVALRDKRSSRQSSILTIAGPSGTGKTHLVTQLFTEQCKASGLPRTIEVSADEVVAEWTEAVRARRVVEMRDLYLSHETLICEDLHAFRASSAAQEAFVSLIDELTGNGGRVILTASASPRDLRGLTTRLISRCHGGVSVAIQSPGRVSRLKLLKHFAAPVQVPIPLETLECLAELDGQCPRELRGQLQRLVQAAELQKCPVDNRLLRRLFTQEPGCQPQRIADVAREVARQFGLTLKQLRSQSRIAPARLPRQAAMYLSREVARAPCAKIGAYFSGRSHSTVVYACEQFEQRLADDPRLLSLTDDIRRTLVEKSRRIRVNNRPAKRGASG